MKNILEILILNKDDILKVLIMPMIALATLLGVFIGRGKLQEAEERAQRAEERAQNVENELQSYCAVVKYNKITKFAKRVIMGSKKGLGTEYNLPAIVFYDFDRDWDEVNESDLTKVEPNSAQFWWYKAIDGSLQQHCFIKKEAQSRDDRAI